MNRNIGIDSASPSLLPTSLNKAAMGRVTTGKIGDSGCRKVKRKSVKSSKNKDTWMGLCATDHSN